MRHISRFSIFASAALAACASSASDMLCAVEPRTDQHFCIRAAELREINGIRYAPLYQGGPREVRATRQEAHANCNTQVLHLKDRQGVSFAGGRFSDSVLAAELGVHLCTAKLPAQRKR